MCASLIHIITGRCLVGFSCICSCIFLYHWWKCNSRSFLLAIPTPFIVVFGMHYPHPIFEVQNCFYNTHIIIMQIASLLQEKIPMELLLNKCSVCTEMLTSLSW